jgi:orotate phosphoribosyltransferase
MAKFDQQKFNQFILENNIIGFFKEPLVLKSGRLAYHYINWRNISEDVFLIDKLTDYVIDFTEDLGFCPDCFYGVPEGATKLGIITQYKWAKKSEKFGPGSHKLTMGRKQPKDHGAPKDRFFVGAPKGKTIILEDVTTTGSSLLEAIDNLRKIESQIIAAIALTDRMEVTKDGKSVKEVIESKKIPYFRMSSALELLPLVYKTLKPDKKIAQKVEEYYQKYGVEKLKLL